MQNLLNLERKLKEMRDQIEGLELGAEVSEEQATFWEKKANGLARDLKIAVKMTALMSTRHFSSPA